MVSREEAGLAPGVRDDGANEHFGVGAGPVTEQVNAMALLKTVAVGPGSGVTVMFVVIEPPATTVIPDASTDKRKFGPWSNVADTFLLAFMVR